MPTVTCTSRLFSTGKELTTGLALSLLLAAPASAAITILSPSQHDTPVKMLAQRTLRAPLQMQARLLRPMAFRAAAASPFSTKPTARQAEKQPLTKKAWFAAPPPPAKNMVCHAY